MGLAPESARFGTGAGQRARSPARAWPGELGDATRPGRGFPSPGPPPPARTPAFPRASPLPGCGLRTAADERVRAASPRRALSRGYRGTARESGLPRPSARQIGDLCEAAQETFPPPDPTPWRAQNVHPDAGATHKLLAERTLSLHPASFLPLQPLPFPIPSLLDIKLTLTYKRKQILQEKIKGRKMRKKAALVHSQNPQFHPPQQSVHLKGTQPIFYPSDGHVGRLFQSPAPIRTLATRVHRWRCE